MLNHSNEFPSLFSLNENASLESRQSSGTIILGDARKELHRFSEGAFQACITSPPYWGLRDYGIQSQIGAENNIKDYLKDLVEVFREVKRTLTPNGILWLNIGDSYTSGNRTWRDSDKKNGARGILRLPKG